MSCSSFKETLRATVMVSFSLMILVLAYMPLSTDAAGKGCMYVSGPIQTTNIPPSPTSPEFSFITCPASWVGVTTSAVVYMKQNPKEPIIVPGFWFSVVNATVPKMPVNVETMNVSSRKSFSATIAEIAQTRIISSTPTCAFVVKYSSDMYRRVGINVLCCPPEQVPIANPDACGEYTL